MTTNALPAATAHRVHITRSKTGTQTHLSSFSCSWSHCGVRAPRIVTTRDSYTEAVEYAKNLKGASLCEKCFRNV